MLTMFEASALSVRLFPGASLVTKSRETARFVLRRGRLKKTGKSNKPRRPEVGTDTTDCFMIQSVSVIYTGVSDICLV